MKELSFHEPEDDFQNLDDIFLVGSSNHQLDAKSLTQTDNGLMIEDNILHMLQSKYI